MLAAKTYVVTGTDTGVGKTKVACGLARAILELGFNTIEIKPIETGCTIRPSLDEDGVLLAQSTGQPRPRAALLRYRAPLAPPAAADIEETQIDYEGMVSELKSHLSPGIFGVIEGAGGLLSPLTWDRTILDLALELNAEAVVVAADKLGTLNHTRLTIEVLRSAGVPVSCVVLSDVHADRRTRVTDPMWRTAPPEDQSVGTNLASLKLSLIHI